MTSALTTMQIDAFGKAKSRLVKEKGFPDFAADFHMAGGGGHDIDFLIARITLSGDNANLGLPSSYSLTGTSLREVKIKIGYSCTDVLSALAEGKAGYSIGYETDDGSELDETNPAMLELERFANDAIAIVDQAAREAVTNSEYVPPPKPRTRILIPMLVRALEQQGWKP